jgi:glycosyltransferase involved in cell wall biosynthesis
MPSIASNEIDDQPSSRNSDEIAVIIPVYMGATFIRELCARLIATLQTVTHSFSIFLIDDRAADNVWPIISDLCGEDHRIKGIQLSRNFGQHHALTAGIDHADARWYVVMDCDLQDAPEDIPLLYAKARQGFDMVIATRRKEGHRFFKRNASRVFYSIFSKLAGFEMNWAIGNFRIFSSQVAAGFRDMREQMRCLPATLSVMGFEVGEIELPHHRRPHGETTYTLKKLVQLGGNMVLAHSQAPLKLAMYTGLVVAGLSMLAGMTIAVAAAFEFFSVTGWASLIVAIFAVGGFQIFITGVVGIYVGKCFDEAKRRPLYFIRESRNLHPHADELALRPPVDRQQ